MKDFLVIVGGLAFVLFIIGLIIAGPFVTIWSLNTLFALGISYTFKTWFATLWLAGIGSGIIKKVASK